MRGMTSRPAGLDGSDDPCACPRQESNPRPVRWKHADSAVDHRGEPLRGEGNVGILLRDPIPNRDWVVKKRTAVLVPQAGIEPALPAPEASALSPELLGRCEGL